MKVRVLTGVGIFLVGLPLLLFSKYLVFPIVLGILAAMAVWEVLRVFSLHKKYELTIPACLVALAMPIFTHTIFFDSQEQNKYLLLLALVLFVFLIYLVFLSVFSKGRMEFGSVSSVFTMVVYVTASFSALGLLRYMELGAYTFGLVFVAAWVCDTFAYFTGRLFGKHKLIPELSPKKTVEGSIGGMAFAVIGFVVYGLIMQFCFELKVNYLTLCLSGLLLSVVSQLGDLFASLIKREHGAKDYSQLLPGHGGIMDRFDSILAVSAVFMIICQVFPPFSVA